MHPYWTTILTRAWSIRFIVLAAVFSGAEVALNLLDATTLGVPQGLFAALASVASAGAFIARLIAQKGLTPEADQ